MKIAVIGANGKAGGLIVKEALARGHQVTGIARNKAKLADAAFPVIEKDILSLTREDLAPFEAVVDAFGVWDPASFGLFTTTTQHLCNILSGTKTRLLIVGGAGSLYTGPDHTVQLLQTKEFPAEYLPLATAMGNSLEYIRGRNDVLWTFLSPAVVLDAGGPRTGSYIPGGEEAIFNSKGESYISYADYAIAMVDELENAKHIQKRFSVIGG